MRNILLALVLIGTVAACNNPEQKTVRSMSDELKELANNYYQERLKYYPLEATAINDNRYNDLLPNDISESYRDTLRNFYTRYQKQLETINEPELTGQDLISYKVLVREMKIQLEELSFHFNLMPVNQFTGLQLAFPVLGSGSGNQPFKTVKDYDNFLKRITAFVVYEDTAIVNMRRGMKEGIMPARILMQRTLPQYKGLIAAKAEESIFYNPVKDMPDSFSDADKQRLKDAYAKAITEELNPCFQRMYDFIEKEYIPACPEAVGISNVPQGKEYYAHLARLWTTTNLTPNEIFEIGQKEVARLQKEMEKVKEETGYKGTMKEFFHYLHTDPKFYPFKKDSDVLNAYLDIEKRMQPQLKKLFDKTPKSPFEVRQTEAFRAASASAEYMQGSPDGTRPGVFYVPILNPAKYSEVGMEDLFLHEAIPGHHYQISLQQENTSLPDFRRFGWYGANGEGWALYCESLGKELGLYTDPYQYFGCLSEEMHRAIRLVVDVGMHLKGWTREQAIQFSLDNEMESEADITAEIERYMAYPAQALSYKIGQMKILELRHKAEQELKDKFSIKEFHNHILENGCLPLDIFEEDMNQWIKSRM
ncbi:MAG TPA: DUF885 domain-containing protein [Bacteroidia bacterium]|nr:DUF885 domain-containing protein [Bacteroidia bacterium]OQB62205.1 MAG: hypothetical protein BWX95_01466 [Bacteroidetes bacterium ADurb.Bin141]HNR49846.1 DUF885 domain-containing protein [Bacteroidia bacterium]HNT83425.1 DUF885 domain-containing protein [Bacteroidia bacterium]